jgi:hypothetical protein
VEFIWEESMGSPMHKFFQAWSESIIKGHGGVIDLVVEPGIRVGVKGGADISEPFVLEPGIQIGTSLKSVVRGFPKLNVEINCLPSTQRRLGVLRDELISSLEKEANRILAGTGYDISKLTPVDTSFITKEEIDKMNRK